MKEEERKRKKERRREKKGEEKEKEREKRIRPQCRIEPTTCSLHHYYRATRFNCMYHIYHKFS